MILVYYKDIVFIDYNFIVYRMKKEEYVAISNILPRKTMQNRTRQQSMAERHDYDQKAEKTNN